MISDLRFAFRMILTHRLFSITLIVTKGLGIGVNTTVRRLFLRRGVLQLGIGLLLGLGVATVTNGLMGALILEQISPRDPIVFVSITLINGVVGMIACWIPARKASQLEPASALRTD